MRAPPGDSRSSRAGSPCRAREGFHIRFVRVTVMSTVIPATGSTPRTLLPPPPLPDSDARWAVFLDVDGTLLDFADDPLAVEVGASLLSLLHALHHELDGALALVSGRELDQLDRDRKSTRLNSSH